MLRYSRCKSRVKKRRRRCRLNDPPNIFFRKPYARTDTTIVLDSVIQRIIKLTTQIPVSSPSLGIWAFKRYVLKSAHVEPMVFHCSSSIDRGGLLCSSTEYRAEELRSLCARGARTGFQDLAVDGSNFDGGRRHGCALRTVTQPAARQKREVFPVILRLSSLSAKITWFKADSERTICAV